MRRIEEGYRSRLPDLSGLDLRALAEPEALAEPDQQALAAALLRLRERGEGAQDSLLYQDSP